MVNALLPQTISISILSIVNRSDLNAFNSVISFKLIVLESDSVVIVKPSSEY